MRRDALHAGRPNGPYNGCAVTWGVRVQPGYMPPLGASPYTWPNIFKNMKRMDYCVDKFDFLGNREVSAWGHTATGREGKGGSVGCRNCTRSYLSGARQKVR